VPCAWFSVGKAVVHPNTIQRPGRRFRRHRDFGFLIASKRLRAITGKRTVPPSEDGNLWGFPEPAE
jgi:hypothetical protein